MRIFSNHDLARLAHGRSALDVTLDGELGHNEPSANDITLADQGPDDIPFLPVLFLHNKDFCYKVYQGL